jgi:hypothetical protein
MRADQISRTEVTICGEFRPYGSLQLDRVAASTGIRSNSNRRIRFRNTSPGFGFDEWLIPESDDDSIGTQSMRCIDPDSQ